MLFDLAIRPRNLAEGFDRTLIVGVLGNDVLDACNHTRIVFEINVGNGDAHSQPECLRVIRLGRDDVIIDLTGLLRPVMLLRLLDDLVDRVRQALGAGMPGEKLLNRRPGPGLLVRGKVDQRQLRTGLEDPVEVVRRTGIGLIDDILLVLLSLSEFSALVELLGRLHIGGSIREGELSHYQDGSKKHKDSGNRGVSHGMILLNEVEKT